MMMMFQSVHRRLWATVMTVNIKITSGSVVSIGQV